MNLKFYQADYLHPIFKKKIKNGILVTNQNNIIYDIVDPKKIQYNIQDIIKYKGDILPGIVNSHCHIELSYLHKKIPKNKGLDGFIKNMITNNSSKIDVKDVKEKADKSINLMIKNGVVAVGDICNKDVTIEVKKNKSISFINFIEIFGLDIKSNEIKIRNAKELKKNFEIVGTSFITPHSFYSINTKLIQTILKDNKELLSIHHYESEQENQLLAQKKGKLFSCFKDLNLNVNSIKHQSSEFFLSQIKNKTLLVHNKNIPKKVLELLISRENFYLCICPLSNIYIENDEPNYDSLFEIFNNITLGTDSLASNNTLDPIAEMKQILKRSNVDKCKLLEALTINGAKSLNIDKNYGTFEKYKQPSIICVENLFELNKQHHVKVIA